MHLAVNGARLHYELHGPAGRPPLLFIHGFPLSGQLWRPLVAPLAERYRLIIPDLRGFGRSELGINPRTGAPPPISMAQYADDMALLLELIGEAMPATIVGLSMGGYIAFEYFRRFQARVACLALADTRPDADPPERRAQRIQTADRVLREGSRVVADDMIQKLFAPGAPPALKSAWHERMAMCDPAAVAAALGAMAARADSTPLLPQITCPTLVIVGEHDTLTPPDISRRMAERILISRLAVVPGAGHMTPVEQPAQFATALDGFMREFMPAAADGRAEPGRARSAQDDQQAGGFVDAIDSSGPRFH